MPKVIGYKLIKPFPIEKKVVEVWDINTKAIGLAFTQDSGFYNKFKDSPVFDEFFEPVIADGETVVSFFKKDLTEKADKMREDSKRPSDSLFDFLAEVMRPKG